MPEDFTIVTDITPSGDVHLTVAGELDVLTAPRLRDALNHAAARPAGIVVVNMAAVTFIDAIALDTLLEADRALRQIGSGLYVSDPTTIVTRVLELTGLSEHFADQPAPRSKADVDDPIEDRIRSIMTELAGIVLTAASLRDDLEGLIRFGCQVLPRCSAASIALLIDGEPSTVAVSERVALELDIAQYESSDGPCLAALSGERIRVDIVSADERFPHFAVGAADRRVNSVLSMPIIHHGDVVGTLNFYSREPDAFDDTADHIARLASGQAAHAIARSDVLSPARERRDQLQAQYDEAALVARAQGALIAAERCSAEQARNLIHHAATVTGDTLLTIAQRVLDTARNSAIG
jgi:anti-anti-sigma factor